MAVRVRSHYWWLYTWVLHWAPAISCGVARGMNRYGSGHDRANERPDEMKLLELYLARVLMGQILVVLGVLPGRC